MSYVNYVSYVNDFFSSSVILFHCCRLLFVCFCWHLFFARHSLLDSKINNSLSLCHDQATLNAVQRIILNTVLTEDPSQQPLSYLQSESLARYSGCHHQAPLQSIVAENDALPVSVSCPLQWTWPCLRVCVCHQFRFWFDIWRMVCWHDAAEEEGCTHWALLIRTRFLCESYQVFCCDEFVMEQIEHMHMP